MFFAKLSMAGTPIVFNIFFCNLKLLTQKWQNYSNNEDRLDFIEGIKGIERIKRHGTVSFEEMKAMLSLE